jgi:hypothetical protein
MDGLWFGRQYRSLRLLVRYLLLFVQDANARLFADELLLWVHDIDCRQLGTLVWDAGTRVGGQICASHLSKCQGGLNNYCTLLRPDGAAEAELL